MQRYLPGSTEVMPRSGRIKYSPEMNVWTIEIGDDSPRIVTPDDIAPGGKYHSQRAPFDDAKRSLAADPLFRGVRIEL